MPIAIPDACTLPTAERPLRLAEFDALFATALREVDTVGPTRARMRLTGPAGLAATVRNLTARETECCSFFTFTVTPEPADEGETLALDVEVPQRYADVLASLAERAGTIVAGQRMLVAAEGLGLDTGMLAATWRDGDCTSTRQRLADAVTARLDQVQAEIADRNRQAVAAGAGTAGWATELGGSASLAEDAARLQAVSAALTTAAPDGPCGDDCGCTTALAAAGTTYRFPHEATSGAEPLVCDLVADAGDAHQRIGVWQQALTRVERRDPLPDTPDGVALRFLFDVDLAGTLARLAAAEYRCCSFGSYTLVIDGTGLRLEVRMPGEAAGMLAAVVGLPDTEVRDAAPRP